MTQIVTDLRKVHERLERTADAAEQDNQRLAVGSLSAQQLRAAEVRAKIGGVGAYAPQRGQGAGEVPVFSVTFNFSGGKTEPELINREDAKSAKGSRRTPSHSWISVRPVPGTL